MAGCAVVWLWGIAGVIGCGDFPEAPWVLREEPRLLALRVEVVEPGPNSAEGLLPIPADRIRSQPLPGDVVELSAFLASTQGQTPIGEIDPVWLMCPVGPCLSLLNEPGARDACGDLVPQGVPCVLPAGETSRFAAPRFDPSVALEEQVGFRVALVGHSTDEATTADCLQRMGDRDKPRWDGCIAGYFGVTYGPSTRLLKAALEMGIEVTGEEFEPEDLDFPVVPMFNPESVPLLIAPGAEGSLFDSVTRILATSDVVTVLEPGGAYRIVDAYDARDAQTWVTLGDEGVRRRTLFPEFSVTTDTPDTLEFRDRGDWVIRAPEVAGRFELFVLISGPAVGSAWAGFEFEVP